MGDVFAIVSKAIFEKEADVGLGDVWSVASYNGSNKVFESTLEEGGRIFMVTVRPPDESLWLVAVLESPTFDAKKKAWTAAANTVPVTDISSLRKTIKFESGKGMSQGKGALGMSLQTPRALGDGDADQIAGLTGGKASKGGKASPAAAAPTKDIGKKSTRSRDRVAALLSAIRDEPDDSVNRHVLADQYDAAGDADRANFIRSQVARSEMPRWDPRAVGMKLDERGFLRQHAAAWRAELPVIKGVSYGDFERGLVAWAIFDDAALIPKHLETIMGASAISGVITRWPRRGARPTLGAVPGLRALTITGTLLQKADLAWLAKSPILSTLHELTLFNSRLDNAAFKTLLESPHLGKLRRLRLPFNQIGNDGIEHLVEAELPQLVELDLRVETADNVGSGGRDGTGINAEGVVALCNWDQMAKLESLDLTGSQIGEAGLTAILTSKNTKRLTTLKIRSVSDYDFENGDDERPDVLCAFEHAKGDRHFEELDISENELTKKAAGHLKKSPALDKLRILTAGFIQADSELASILGGTWGNQLHVVNLNETRLAPVKAALELDSVHTISAISSFPWSNLKGVVTPLIASKRKALQSLDLLGCSVDDAALKKLGAATTLPALIELRVGKNDDNGYSDDENVFSEDAAAALLASKLGKQLRSASFGIAKLDRLPPIDDVGDDDDDDDEDYDDE